MSRHILTYKGLGRSVADVREMIDAETDIAVIEGFGRTLIVEGPSDSIAALTRQIPEWTIGPVRRLSAPRIGAARMGPLRSPD